MKKYKINADPRVKTDLKEARDYLNSKRKGWGIRFIKEYRGLLQTLQSNPDFEIRYKNVHCLPMKTFKYLIHFRIDSSVKSVHIYAVISTHRDPNIHYL
ncbi:MAG: type II toxin-antitoxin system RelE/ParE family toxin [Limnohabitans sp.]|nr:type II toxin-antitoxin system RelE/ParE family toxin [Limnohabitans sp.]